MQIWKNCWENCTADIYYIEFPAVIRDEGYIVRLSDDVIEVAYDDEEGAAVCYRGNNNGDGHFDLTAPERNGRASLHCFPNSHFLEGYWQEGNARGMWQIHLK